MFSKLCVEIVQLGNFGFLPGEITHMENAFLVLILLDFEIVDDVLIRFELDLTLFEGLIKAI